MFIYRYKGNYRICSSDQLLERVTIPFADASILCDSLQFDTKFIKNNSYLAL